MIRNENNWLVIFCKISLPKIYIFASEGMKMKIHDMRNGIEWNGIEWN